MPWVRDVAYIDLTHVAELVWRFAQRALSSDIVKETGHRGQFDAEAIGDVAEIPDSGRPRSGGGRQY